MEMAFQNFEIKIKQRCPDPKDPFLQFQYGSVVEENEHADRPVDRHDGP